MAHVLIVEARFYSRLNDMLLDGVRSALEAEGHSHETVTVPGALEVPAAISLAADAGRFDAYVALGVVIRGETYHFEVVSNESARGFGRFAALILARLVGARKRLFLILDRQDAVADRQPVERQRHDAARAFV